MNRTIKFFGRRFLYVVACLVLLWSRAAAQSDSSANWRLADLWVGGGMGLGIQVSASRQIRIVTSTSNGGVVTRPIERDTLVAWLARVTPQIEAATTKDLFLKDAILISPYPSAANFTDYSVTLADSDGVWVAFRSKLPVIRNFLGKLEEVSMIIGMLTDADLHREGSWQRTQPKPLNNPSPKYPAQRCDTMTPLSALPNGVGGRVRLGFWVDVNGRPDMKGVRVLETTGPEFTRSARESLAIARFEPATVEGHPVPAYVEQPYEYMSPPGPNSVVVVTTDKMTRGCIQQ